MLAKFLHDICLIKRLNWFLFVCVCGRVCVCFGCLALLSLQLRWFIFKHSAHNQISTFYLFFLLVVYEIIWDRRGVFATAADSSANALSVMICFSCVFVFNSSNVIDYLFLFLLLMPNLLSSQSRNSFAATPVDWWNFSLPKKNTERNSNCYFETRFENSFFVCRRRCRRFSIQPQRECVYSFTACVSVKRK